MVKLKRAYEPASADDGLRILVERLWPRGVTKKAAKIDLWLKDLSPTPQLRAWYGHDPARWARFRARYRAELKKHAQFTALLRLVAQDRVVTFIYAARDEQRNSAVVLKDFIEK
jgi:uncharacterized protein YeaO (DUF488 family)